MVNALLDACQHASATGARTEIDRYIDYNGSNYDVRADLYIPEPIPTGTDDQKEPALIECKTRVVLSAKHVLSASKAIDGGTSSLERDILSGRLTLSGPAHGVPYSAIATAFKAELRPAVVLLPGGRFGSQVLKLFRDLSSFALSRGRWQSAWRPLAARSRRVSEIAVQKAIATRIQTCAALVCRRAGYGFPGLAHLVEVLLPLVDSVLCRSPTTITKNNKMLNMYQ